MGSRNPCHAPHRDDPRRHAGAWETIPTQAKSTKRLPILTPRVEKALATDDEGQRRLLNIELLRPLEWLSFYEVAVGRTIDLDLSEMGAEVGAEVLAVEPCPPIQPGPGNVVTGTFAIGRAAT